MTGVIHDVLQDTNLMHINVASTPASFYITLFRYCFSFLWASFKSDSCHVTL